MKSFEEYVLDFLKLRKELNFSEATVTNARRSLKYFNNYLREINILNPSEITKKTLADYRSHLFYWRKKNGMPLSVQEQRKRLSHIKIFLSHLTREDIIIFNPAFDMLMPRQPSTIPEFFLTREEMTRVLKTPDLNITRGVRDRTILEIFCASGIRRKEMTSLKITDIHFEKEVLFIRQGKGQKDRMVPISQRALGWIDTYLNDSRVKLNKKDSTTLFLNRYGDSIHPDFLTKIIRVYLNEANIKKPGSCHLFRHTLATIMLENGAQITDICQMLGHKRIETTQVYAKVVISELKKIYKKTQPLR